MTETEKDAIRQKVRVSTERLADQMAPLYLGRTCPLLKAECQGPCCQLFLPMAGEDGRINAGACAIALVAKVSGGIQEAAVVAAEALHKSIPIQQSPQLVRPGSIT